MRNVCKKMIAGLLALAMLICCVPFQTVQAAESSYDVKLLYAAFGDSITEGDSSYVSYINAYLKNKTANYYSYNMGMSGMKASDMAEILSNSSNAYHANVMAGIKQCDVITLDFGSNDILVPVIESFCDRLGCTQDTIGTTIASWQTKLSSGSYYQRLVYASQLRSICLNIQSDISDSNMQKVMTQYKADMTTIIRIIHSANPSAKIYIGNLYNPYDGFDALRFLDVTVIDFDAFAEKYTQQANSIISSIAGSYDIPVVDIASAIKPAYLNADASSYNYDPHPNAAGHQVIGQLFVSEIKKDI